MLLKRLYKIETDPELLVFHDDYYHNTPTAVYLIRAVKHFQLQWNLNLTKSQGTGEISSLNRGFVTSNSSI